MALLSRIIRITTRLRPRGVLRRETGRTLVLTPDALFLAPNGSAKVKSYSRLRDVGEDFAATTEPYLAAQAYFSQRPYPRNLLIGRWTNADVDNRLLGGDHSPLSDLTTISAGSFRFAGADFTGVDLSAAGDLDTVAGLIQTELRTGTGLATATCTYDATNERFVVGSPRAVTAAGFFAPHSSGTGDDLSELLGLTPAAGAQNQPGQEAETEAEALDAIQRIDGNWNLLGYDKSLNGTASMTNIANWIAANPGVVGYAHSNEAGAVDPTNTTALINQVAASDQSGVIPFWTPDAGYHGLSLLAAFSSVNFNLPSSLITGMFRSLPGQDASALTDGEIDVLTARRINYYTTYGGEAIVAEGWIGGDAGYIDVQYWINWFENAVQVAVFNLLRREPRLPINGDLGLARIQETIEVVCRQGVRNGGIAPGEVSPELAGEIRDTIMEEFDGNLTNGYLVYHPAPEASDPERTTPPFSTFLKGAEAAHKVDIGLTFEE